MKLKLFTSIILISLILAVPNYAQEQEIDLRELYNLCSKFPLNSRCQGRNLPILLADRPGDEVSCHLLFSQPKDMGNCKVAINPQEISAYFEEGAPIAFLNNKQATGEIKIPYKNIFYENLKLVKVYESMAYPTNPYIVATVEIGFIVESDLKPGNRSNFLTIVTNKDLGIYMARQLTSISTSVTKIPWQSQLLNQTETLANSVDKSTQIRQLLQTKVCLRCDLRGADLQSANLENANLEGANMENANLTGAKLDDAYLVGANLNGANLTKADMEAAKLAISSLVKANLEEAKLRGANLQSTNLDRGILRNANLNADDDKVTDLKYANLQQADLSQAKISGVDLRLANLEEANLESANLSDFTSRYYKHWTNLSGANLRRANLNNANLEEAFLVSANLSNASLMSTRLKNADMRNANLRGADLNNANLERANLCGATMPDGSRSNQGCK